MQVAGWRGWRAREGFCLADARHLITALFPCHCIKLQTASPALCHSTPPPDELISKATVTVTRTHRSVPYQARTLKACDIVACPLQPGHNDLTYNFVALPDMPLVGGSGCGCRGAVAGSHGWEGCRWSLGHVNTDAPVRTITQCVKDGVIVQLASGDQLVFCVWIALRNPPFSS